MSIRPDWTEGCPSYVGDENSVRVADNWTVDLAPSSGHPAPAIARRAAPFASCAGAFLWVVGVFLVWITAGGVIPSDAAYLWIGAISVALGILFIPIVLVVAPKLFAQGAGLIICAVMVITGALLMLGVAGSLGVPAPAWIATWSELPFVALFVWILSASFVARGRSQLGPVVLWFAVLNIAVLLVALGIALHPYTHTNETDLVDALLALVFLWSLPAWLVAVAVRLWRPVR